MSYFAFETGRAPVRAANGLCATSHPLASRAAIDVLKAGGNAIDAALTASAVLCVVEPMMTGLGGDCFALMALRGGETVVGLNGSGRAPTMLDGDVLRALGHETMPVFDAHAVTIPGAVDAWCALLAHHGTMDFDSVLAPAKDLARRGFDVTPRVAHDWITLSDRMAETAAGQQHWLLNASPPKAGSRFRLPGLAECLEIIAKNGRDGFYQGPVAEDMVSALMSAGGLHSLDDFAATKSTDVAPIHTGYGDYNVLELPPNGRGLTALLMLNILSCLDFSALDPLSADRFHLQVEVQKLAYGVCDEAIADPDFVDIPAQDILSADFAARLADQIDLRRASSRPMMTPGNLQRETVYISVVDRDRNAVSFINSIYYGFGSGIVSERYGITFQNRGASFYLTPGHPNYLEGGKRPQHTIIPALLCESDRSQRPRVVMPFGVMGGDYQPMGHVQVLANMLDFGLDIQQSIDMPRLLFDGESLLVEPGFDQKILSDLDSRGHTINMASDPLGGGQAVWIDWASGDLIGGSDPRKDGCALGY